MGTVTRYCYQRLDVGEVGDVTVVRFRDRKIIDDVNIQELGNELFRLMETFVAGLLYFVEN